MNQTWHWLINVERAASTLTGGTIGLKSNSPTELFSCKNTHPSSHRGRPKGPGLTGSHPLLQTTGCSCLGSSAAPPPTAHLKPAPATQVYTPSHSPASGPSRPSALLYPEDSSILRRDNPGKSGLGGGSNHTTTTLIQPEAGDQNNRTARPVWAEP